MPAEEFCGWIANEKELEKDSNNSTLIKKHLDRGIMENSFTIKNFRVFDEKGETFSFKPITFLTGTNGSGKSSLTKAIMLMHDFLTQSGLRHDTIGFTPQSKLDFSRPGLKLGGYDCELQRGSNSNEMSFEFTLDSIWDSPLIGNFKINYSFASDEKDPSKGVFSSLTLWMNQQQVFKWGAKDQNNLESFCLQIPGLMSSFLYYCSLLNLLIISHPRYTKANTLREGVIWPIEYTPEYRKFAKLLLSANEDNADDTDKVLHNYRFSDSRKAWQFKQLANRCKSFESFNNPLALARVLKMYDDNHILFYFPVLDQLQALDNEALIETIQSAKLKFEELEWEKDLVIKEYLNSKADNFLDFYRQIEQDYLANCPINEKRPLFFRMLGGDRKYSSFIDSVLNSVRLQFSPNSAHKSGFELIYDFLSNWTWYDDGEHGGDRDFVTRSFNEFGYYFSRHRLYEALCDYLSIIFNEVLCPQSFLIVNYFGDFHTNIKRAYYLDEESDPLVSKLKAYLQVVRGYLGGSDRILSPGDFINKWLKEFGIGEVLLINHDEEGKVVKLFVKKNEDGDMVIPLSDEGYGIYQLVVLLITIETELLKAQKQMVADGPNVKYSQHSYFYGPCHTIVIEEPESNLHPAFQSKLADLFYSATQVLPQNAIQFIIETHSEYLIRATQAIVANTVENEKGLKDIPFIVYYMEKGGKAYDMEYQVSGRFKRPFGTGFFDEAGKSAIEILKKERRMKDGTNA